MALAIIFDSVGVGEWFVLLAVILIVVGPKRLPSTARKVGAYYSKFRRAAESFKRQLLDMDTEFTNTVRDAANEVKDAVSDMNREFTAPIEPAPVEPAPVEPAPIESAPGEPASGEATSPSLQKEETASDVPQDQQS